MPLQLIQTPPSVALAGNPISFIIKTEAITGSFHRIHLQIFQTISENEVIIGEDAVEVDSNLLAVFDIHSWLQSLFIPYHFSYRISEVIRKTNYLKSYFINYYEVYYNETGRMEGTKTIESIRYVLNGKLTDLYDQNYRLNDKSYYDDLKEKRLFLTLQPRTKIIDINQPERLYFLNYNPDISTIAVKVQVFFDDGSDMMIDKSTLAVQPFAIYEISTGFKSLELSDLENFDRKVKKHSVWLVAQDSSIISETFTYQIDRRKYIHVRYLIFRNRIGGYDTVRCFGIQTADNEFENQIGYTYAGKVKLDTQATEKFTVNTGIIDTKYNYYLQELFESVEVWEICSEGVFSITIDNKKSEARQGNKFIYNQTIEYTRDLIVELFSPNQDPIQIYGDYSFLDYSYDYNI